jgi:hypothetical protein
VDRTVGGAENQKRYDNPKRTTLTDLPKAQVPERKPTLSGLPAPPALPLEHAPTKPAPRNPLEKQTWRLPAPPSALARARRTDPPPTSIRVPADETTLQSPLGSTLPPVSESADVASNEALRRRAEAAERDLAEARRQVRLRAETASPATYPPPVKQPTTPAPMVVHHGVSSETLEAYRKAQTKLMLAVAGLLVAVAAPCALWLTNASVKNESDTKRTQVQVIEAVKTSEGAEVKTRGNDKEIAELKSELAAFKLYVIALQKRQGVAIRLPDGAKQEDLPKLEFEAPLRKVGEVKSGVGLIVQTPP